ncbi:hypothetical protein IB270_35880, partial [Ensifer sp. ENS05]|uniref:hypothetical protein n=1 Tax=Ensifer sp. ENS05 TaxID=2769277 RepID=UPI00178702EA
ASLRDLTHGVPLKIFAEIRFAHDALPASKLGKKASTNLGAIQVSQDVDQGEILCQGPKLNLVPEAHRSRESIEAIENAQKAHSDWPSLVFALKGLALGHFALDDRQRHSDGLRVVTYEGKHLPLSGDM